MEDMKMVLREAVAMRLSAAPDSVAKAELIEELTENLYCRYADLTAAGMEDNEARAKAVDALGDTDELVAYLNSLEPDQPLPDPVEEEKEDGQFDELLRNVEDIIKGAMRKARTVFHEARETIKESGFFDRGSVQDADFEETESALEEKEQEIAAAEEALEELESALEALEAVSDSSAVAGAIAELNGKIEAKKAEIRRLQEEYDAIETRMDELEEAPDAEDDEDKDEEQAAVQQEGKGWKVTVGFDAENGKFRAGSGTYRDERHSFEIDSDEIKTAVKDAMKDIEDVLREAKGAARSACDGVKEAAKAAAGTNSEEITVVPGEPVEAEQLKGIDVQTVSGDVTIRMTQPADGDVLVGGDIEDIEVFRSADGVLTIRPVKTETSSFFFGRGIFNGNSCTDVVLELPCRSWEFLKVQTSNGDVHISGGAPVDAVIVRSVSGDIDGELPACARVQCKTTNGDVRWSGDASDLKVESVNGDVFFRGRADSVWTQTTNGDMELEGSLCGVTAKTISGDLCVRSDVMPGKLDLGSTSGDMRVDIPDGGSFTVKFHAVSGEFCSDFFTGALSGRNSVFRYQGGGERLYSFGTISGDAELRKYR